MGLLWALLLLTARWGGGWGASGASAGRYNESESWDVNHQKGVFKNQNLKLNKLNHPTNPYHTCYRVQCFGNQCPSEGATRDFCYPAVVVTGLPKCGTSAMYNLLSKLPGATVMAEKENCPYTRRRSHWLYFQSLPAMHTVTEQSLIIDGCIDVLNNMKMRDILHQPDTSYIVMMRDYADMLWSSYNFWCHLNYDKQGCSFDRYTNKQFHVRSPELFHELVLGDSNGTALVQPFYYPMHRPCANAGGYYTEYADFHLERVGLGNATLAVAAEELEVRPEVVLRRVALFLQMDPVTVKPSRLRSAKRLNAQDNKGTDHAIAASAYKPGVYAISDYRPMLPETRALLNRCWATDCVAVAERYGYFYAACLDDYLDKHHMARPNAGMESHGWRTQENSSLAKSYAMEKLVYILPN